MSRNDRPRDTDDIERLLTELGDKQADPSEALFARVLADAEAEIDARKRRTQAETGPARGWLARLLPARWQFGFALPVAAAAVILSLVALDWAPVTTQTPATDEAALYDDLSTLGAVVLSEGTSDLGDDLFLEVLESGSEEI